MKFKGTQQSEEEEKGKPDAHSLGKTKYSAFFSKYFQHL